MMRRKNDELETGDALASIAARDARASPARRSDGAKHSVFSDSDATPNATPAGPDRRKRPERDGGEYGSPGSAREANEEAWEVQRATAASILDADRAGTLPASEHAYVGWATALANVAAEMESGGADLWANDPRRAARLPARLQGERPARSLGTVYQAGVRASGTRRRYTYTYVDVGHRQGSVYPGIGIPISSDCSDDASIPIPGHVRPEPDREIGPDRL